MREEENESEEGAVEDDYGPGEIGGFGKISGKIEKNPDQERKDEIKRKREPE